MRKYFFSFWLLLAISAATAVFNSCGKDEFEIPNEPEPPQEIAVTGISLNETTLTLVIGESETLAATVTPDNASDKTVTWESSDSTVATVDDNGKVTAVAEGTVTITAKASDKIAECVVTVIDPVEINGVRWARRNVDMPGTFAPNIASSGMFYQWNRKIGWSPFNPLVNSNGGTEWNGALPAGNTWEKINDPCPQGWRIPTIGELVALSNSSSEWRIVNGVLGRQFGTVPNTIFLPAGGWRFHVTGALNGTGTLGSYWSSTVGNASNAWFFYFNISSVSAGDSMLHSTYGMSVRCVAE